jgi:hypothetical protein
MGNKNGYLARRVLAAIPIFGLLLLAVSGPAFAGVKDNNFHGRYLTSYHGFDSSITGTAGEPNPPAIPFAVSGAMSSDGKGIIKGFENIDYGSPGTGSAATCTFTGTYTVGPASNAMGGLVTLNVSPSCATVTCTGTTTPNCTPGTFSPSSPTQWFCALSGPSGKALACTEMGEAASGTTFQTPISALTWDKAE